MINGNIKLIIFSDNSKLRIENQYAINEFNISTNIRIIRPLQTIW